MDQILLGLGAAGAALLVIAIAVALWEHRRHLGEMRQQLAWSENTHDLLQAHARDVDARLATLSATVHAQLLAAHQQPSVDMTSTAMTSAATTSAASQTAVQTAGTALSAHKATINSEPHRRTTAHAGSAAAAMAAAQAAVTQQWIDTEPMVLTSPVPDFDPTLPIELSEH